MDKRIKITFLALVLTQGLHSVEEYFGKLWDVYAPAKYLCGLVSKDRETGFIIINISFFLFGLLCWLAIVYNYSFARGLIWFWIISESINGIGHLAWAIDAGDYEPGAATAPVILLLAAYLTRLSIKNSDPTTSAK